MNQFAAFGCDSRKGIQRLPDDLAGRLGTNGGRSPAIGRIADASKTSLVHEHHQWRAPQPGASLRQPAFGQQTMDAGEGGLVPDQLFVIPLEDIGHDDTCLGRGRSVPIKQGLGLFGG